MCKFLVMIISLATLTVFAGVAAAGTVQIGGTHSQSELSALHTTRFAPKTLIPRGEDMPAYRGPCARRVT